MESEHIVNVGRALLAAIEDFKLALKSASTEFAYDACLGELQVSIPEYLEEIGES